MRKLIVLMLVLCMASLANASYITITGTSGETSIVVAPGTTVLLQLNYVSDGGVDVGGIDVVIDAGSAIVTAAGVSIGSDVGGVRDYSNPGDPGATGVFTFPVSAIQYNPANTTSAPIMSGDTLIGTFSVLFGGGMLDLSPVLNLIGDTAGGDITTSFIAQGVSITPEPATMAILGLGGLLLRRKKA